MREVCCVDAVLRLLGVFHDVLYGDVAPVRPGSTLGVVSVRLSRSLFVPGRQLEKGGRLPSPPLLAPTPGPLEGRKGRLLLNHRGGSIVGTGSSRALLISLPYGPMSAVVAG